MTAIKLRRQKNRGVALITAMLISTLATLVAANLSWDNALDVRRTMTLLNRDQALQVGLGAESWIASILLQDKQDSDVDHLAEIWAQELPGLPIDGGEVFGKIEDLQGRFNINNLVDDQGQTHQPAVEQFQRLLIALDLDPRFAGVAADWIDGDDSPSFPDGAEDGIYTGMLPPYRTANQGLTSVSELAAIEGMDRVIFNVLEPHIAALPGNTKINVNTATPAVLLSLDENMTTADVESLLSEREAGGFGDMQSTFTPLVQPDVLANLLTENTQHFRLKVVVQIDTVRVTVNTLFFRGSQGGVTPILRSLGTT